MVIGQALGALASYTVVLIGYGVFRLSFVFLMSPSIVIVSAYTALSCVMPRKSELPWLVLRWLALNITFSTASMIFAWAFYSDGLTDVEVTLQVCIFLPLIREVSSSGQLLASTALANTYSARFLPCLLPA